MFDRFLDKIMYDLGLGSYFLIIGIVVALFAVPSYYLLKADKEQWDAFVKTNNCVLVEKGKSSVAVTQTINPANGQLQVGTAVIDGVDRYLCDDGVVYQR